MYLFVHHSTFCVFVFQQYGLRSRGFNGAYFAGQEKRVHRFHEMIESYFKE